MYKFEVRAKCYILIPNIVDKSLTSPFLAGFDSLACVFKFKNRLSDCKCIQEAAFLSTFLIIHHRYSGMCLSVSMNRIECYFHLFLFHCSISARDRPCVESFSLTPRKKNISDGGGSNSFPIHALLRSSCFFSDSSSFQRIIVAQKKR